VKGFHNESSFRPAPKHVKDKWKSRQPPDTALDVTQKTEVAACCVEARRRRKHLKLLANLIFDVLIIGVQLLQFALESVNIVVRKFLGGTSYTSP
jgi:hypothetical protein